MMIRTLVHGLLLSLLSCVAIVPAAQADNTGEPGELRSVQVLTPSADIYGAFHGRLVLRTLADGEDVEYRWGGTSCGAKVLSESQVALLADLAATPYMVIEPLWKPGQGMTLCLVGFTASNIKFN